MKRADFPPKQSRTKKANGDSPIESIITPETLMLIRELIHEKSALYPIFKNLFQMDVILDTNVIISDILWLSKKRKNPYARPTLLETIACGTLKAYSPSFLIQELNKHLPRLAEEHGIALAVLESHWEKYRPLITLIEVEAASEEEIARAQDPHDLPYIKLQKKIGAKIYTRDSDIAAMSGDVVRDAIIVSLRDYSYHATVEYSIKFLGLSSVIITQATIIGAVELVKMLSRQAQKLPSWVLQTGGFLAALALIHPRSRAAIGSWIKRIPTGGSVDGITDLVDFLAITSERHDQAQKKALSILQENALQLSEKTVVGNKS